MIALLFEVCPRPGQMQRYLDMAVSLRPHLEQCGGCEFIDRFRDLDREGWLLSYQIWRDAASMDRWRGHADHHGAQAIGREQVFSDYRIRVASVVRATNRGQPVWRLPRLATTNDPAGKSSRWVVIVDSTASPDTPNGTPSARFESLYRPGKFAQLATASNIDEAIAMADRSTSDDAVESIRVCEVERDYSMVERAEAPQHFAPVPSYRS